MKQHAGVTNIDTDFIVLALTVAVTEQSHLFFGGDDSFNLYTDFVLSSTLLLEFESIIDNFVVETFGCLTGTTLA